MNPSHMYKVTVDSIIDHILVLSNYTVYIFFK